MRFFTFNLEKPLKHHTCGNLISRDEFIHSKRKLDTNVFIMVNEGTLYISQNKHEYTVNSQQYILLRASEEHYGFKASYGKLSYYWVHFDFENEVNELNSLTPVESKSLYQNTVTDHTGNLPEHIGSSNKIILPEKGQITTSLRANLLFNQLLDLSMQDNRYPEQILDYALSLLIMETSREFLEMNLNMQKNIPANIARIREWIKANYYKSFTVKDIATEFDYNPDYLSALFHRTTGYTLVNYLNKIRIDISKTLITTHAVSIKEAAYSCGFSDEKYYMKTFKKFEGMTPSQYKKAFSRKMMNSK